MVTATLFCVIFSFPVFFRSSSWQLPHIQERWEEEGKNHHTCSLLFILEFCGTPSLTILLSEDLQGSDKLFCSQSHRLAVLVMPPSPGTGSFSSPLLAGAGSLRQGKKTFFLLQRQEQQLPQLLLSPCSGGRVPCLTRTRETPSTALSHCSSWAEQASTAPKLRDRNFHA